MIDNNTKFSFHPGETLAEMLEDRNMSVKDFSKVSGLSETTIFNLIEGTLDINDSIAESLEIGFNVKNSKSFWLNLQSIYNKDSQLS